MMNEKLFALLICLVAWLPCSAQGVHVEQTIESVGILIGQQAHMTVKVTAPEGAKIIFPEWKSQTYLVPGVELLSVEGDTTLSSRKEDGGEGKNVCVSRRLTITSFDENLYSLPPVEVTVDGSKMSGQQLALKVITVDVDTLHPNEFFPPKDVMDNPFLWSEWRTPLLLTLLCILLILPSVWLYRRLKANKPILSTIRIIKRVLPHQKAMKAIDQIKAEHMTISENQKEYYTRLTDTLRQYIDERFGFNAMEMTTPEIIHHLKQAGDEAMIGELKELFETADLVKFAKYSTLIGENDLNLVNANNFIDQTKLEGQPTEERVVPELSDADMKMQRARQVIIILLWSIGVMEICLLAYVVWRVMQLV